jgi:Zn-dependent protease
MDENMLAQGALWYVVFLFSTTCHEAAHAFAAKLGGDLTAFHGGQVSLDPIPHIRREPFGMVLFPILSFVAGGWMMGWASAPYDPHWSYRHPRRASWMALAGPSANFSLAALAAIAMNIGLLAGWFRLPSGIRFAQLVEASSSGAGEAVATVLSILFSLNVLLGSFNLLPVPPLDGWSAIGIALPEDAIRKMEDARQRFGMFSIIGLLIAWQVFDYVYDPIYGAALRALYAAWL